ncbi:MAG: hypothetical protein ACT4OU_11285 [Hyphomicrobium sp.]
MTAYTPTRMLALAALSVAISGCSNSSTPLATASVAPEKQVTAAPRVDPACVALASQIDNLRSEGTVDRLEKAAAGKSASVQVKRASLAKQAELNKANADYQAKCGPPMARPQTATLAPTAPPQATPATTPAAVATPPKVNSAAAGN